MRKRALVIENSKELTGLHFTTHSSKDKLAGINSLNTNCKSCKGCIAKMKVAQDPKAKKAELVKEYKKACANLNRQLSKIPEKQNIDLIKKWESRKGELLKEINSLLVPVCGYCFADSTIDMRPTMADPLENNTRLLTSKVLRDEQIPFINRLVFRFESFGDLQNDIQAINYIKIALKNPNCTFAWWTKNPWFIKSALEKMGLETVPENVIVILSSFYVNRQNKIPKAYSHFIKGVFTVYDKYFLESHPEIKISCGSRQCLACMKCYTRTNEVFYINELVK